MSKKIHRFIKNYTIHDGQIHITDSDLIHQWKNVLKFKTGEQIILAHPNALEALCEIEKLDKKEAFLKVIQESENTKTVKRLVTLYCAVLKRENFELVVQKATELGVKNIIPIKTDRTIKQNINMERLEKIATEASELAGRNSVPEISDIVDFEKAISENTADTKILFDITGEKLSHHSETWGKTLAIFIGPEGGFTESELALAQENNIQLISISPLTLRGETATIVATYIAVNL